MAAYHDNNYLPLMLDFYRSHRSVLFQLTETLQMQSTTQSRTLIDALSFIHDHRLSRRDWLPDTISLDFASAGWQSLVRQRFNDEVFFNRRQLEVCVFFHLAAELKTGDVCVVGSQNYADYR